MKDQLYRKLYLENRPKRIVSLVPSQTELLVDLGLEDGIVGVTKFCVHPKHLRQQKTVVGGTKQVNFDKIKGLQPDIILCNKEENTKEMISELEQIAPVHISDVYTIADSLELIEMYGTLFHKPENAQALIDDIRLRLHAFQKLRTEQSKLRVAYFIWKNPWMVAARSTFIDDMLSINNFQNVYQDKKRYPEISFFDLKRRQPHLILLSSEPYPFKATDIETFKSVFPETTLRIVDGEAFSWFGSRLLKAFEYFEELHKTL